MEQNAMTNLQQMVADIQIEQAELGELPNDGWDNYPWVDQITYVPSDSDTIEASELFGELQDDLDVEEFEEWIDSLQSTRFFQVRQAIETLRSALADYQKDLDITRLLRMIHPA